MPTIVLVSHSVDIANGTKQLLEQMVSDVDVLACGGTDDGGIGTSFNSIQDAINHLEDDALCFFDLGSAEMNLDMAIEMYEGDHQVLKVVLLRLLSCLLVVVLKKQLKKFIVRLFQVKIN